MKKSPIPRGAAIVLTAYEKRSLARFLGFYISSSLILIIGIVFLVFVIEKNQIQKNAYNQMLLQSSKIAQIATFEHMSGRRVFDPKILQGLTAQISSSISQSPSHKNSPSLPFEKNTPGHNLHDSQQNPMPQNGSKIQISLFDANKKNLYGNLPFIESKKRFFVQGHHAYLLDNSAFGHLGIAWILIQRDFGEETARLIFFLVLGAGISLGLVLVFGVILGRMFLQPVRQGLELLDHFIKDITHELNTPISALLMSANSLKNGVNNRKLSRIEQACKRIEFLYNNLTFLFLGEAGEQKEHIDFLALLGLRLEMFEEHFLSKSLRIQTDLSPCVLFADRESITRMLDNLLSNAIKYNEQNGRIFIALSATRLRIQNSGELIDPSIKDQIKMRYFRQNSRTKGYGIGLDIVQKVALSHHYTFVISTQDNLNTFEIFF
ncbi:sensor histidine kinase [Helicobacter mustelae]|uniref:sensor histidine kinase n=1 Tax=Helicobacter mustelae TaxID=217 RepID=UPI00032201CF|nr:HAMP domain-containing sensor histidine kinase [Helicobacter mustelae]SQH72131.1 two-component regulation system CdrRS, sensor component CrdS [Helicobacter mustelae]